MRFNITTKFTLFLAALITFGANSQLQADDHIKIGLNARVRAEVSSNKDFDNSKSDGMDFVGSRFRVNLTGTPNDKLTIFFQPQFTKYWGDQVTTVSDYTTTPVTTKSNNTSGNLYDTGLDVHQAYIKYDFSDKFNMQMGRSELNYGDQLVVGGVGWHNVARSFDVVRLQYNYGMGKVDLFWSEIVEESLSTTTGNDSSFTGLYFANDFGDMFKNVDVYYFSKAANVGDGSTNTTNAYGLRMKSNITDSFDYRLEYTSESITNNDDTETQYDLELGYKVAGYRLSAEYFSASKGYDQLYPTAHKWLGMADFFKRQNITGIRVGVAGNIIEGLSANLNYHMFSRVDDKVTAYNFGGGAYGTTGTKTGIGTEIDFILTKKYDDNFSFQLGYAIVSAGDYMKDNTAGDSGSFGFFQTVAKF